MDLTTRIFKSSVALSDGLYICDTIYWNGTYWLVPEWHVDQTTKKRQPVRIIRLDADKYKESENPLFDFDVEQAIPNDVFEGRSPGGTTFHIVCFPHISVS